MVNTRMWLAHALTLSRIPLALAMWWAWGHPAWSAAIIVVAGLTDTADGRIARRARRRGAGGPDIGDWLDPVVDKLFVVTVLAAIWVRSQIAHPVAVIALIGARELVLVPLAAVYFARRRPHLALRADAFGKIATIAQLIALCVIALAPGYALPVAAIAAALGLAAAGHYVVTVLTALIEPRP